MEESKFKQAVSTPALPWGTCTEDQAQGEMGLTEVPGEQLVQPHPTPVLEVTGEVALSRSHGELVTEAGQRPLLLTSDILSTPLHCPPTSLNARERRAQNR